MKVPTSSTEIALLDDVEACTRKAAPNLATYFAPPGPMINKSALRTEQQ